MLPTAVAVAKAGRRATTGDDGLDDAEAFFNLSSHLEVAADSEINLDDDDETGEHRHHSMTFP